MDSSLMRWRAASASARAVSMATFTKVDSAARDAKWATTSVAWLMAASMDGLVAQSSHGFC